MQVRHVMSRVSVQFCRCCLASCYHGFVRLFWFILAHVASYALFLVCENRGLDFELAMQIICAHDSDSHIEDQLGRLGMTEDSLGRK